MSVWNISKYNLLQRTYVLAENYELGDENEIAVPDGITPSRNGTLSQLIQLTVIIASKASNTPWQMFRTLFTNRLSLFPACRFNDTRLRPCRIQMVVYI